MLDLVRKKNPKYEILSVHSQEFEKYGMVISQNEFPQMEQFVRATEMPEDEFYKPCEEQLMEMGAEADRIKNEIYGQVPCQIGYYNGYADRLNAVEFHKCSEVLIQFEDCILILASKDDMRDGRLHSSRMKYFYVEKGTCVELYGGTLHWAPCMVSEKGVRQVVVQQEGTNTPLLLPVEDKNGENLYLLERNKWVLIHEEAKNQFAEGAFIGIDGENPKIVC